MLLHDKELLELLRNFYILTGMTISLTDTNHIGVAAYPTTPDTFCNIMRQLPEFQCRCIENNTKAFNKVRKTKKLELHICHAGLTEATAPIIKNGKVIGYLMFGQISSGKSKSEFQKHLANLCEKYGVTDDLSKQIKNIKHRNVDQIHSASKILEALCAYIQLKEYIQLSERKTMKSLEDFVENHISEDITIERLCNEFGVSRTQLYNLTRQYVAGGIASFIRDKRMHKAKELLLSSDMPIPEIASAVGFSDYNYFMKVFKQTFGLSPRKMLKDYKN